jgi:hypothetical protein
MATTRTPGITILTDGRRFIDKRYLGVRIGLRAGAITQEQAENRLDIEIARVRCDLARKAPARPTFTDCASEISNHGKFMIRRWNPSCRYGLPVARVRPRSIAVWKPCAPS